jgi:hypothetical protein
VFIKEAITDEVANNMIALTLYLDSLDQKRIYYWLNCPGGEVGRGAGRRVGGAVGAPGKAVKGNQPKRDMDTWRRQGRRKIEGKHVDVLTRALFHPPAAMMRWCVPGIRQGGERRGVVAQKPPLATERGDADGRP